MNGHDNRNDWTVVAAIALIALGVWFLLGNVFGEFWQDAVRRAVRMAWPLALIGLGVLLYLASSRGAFSPDSTGKRLMRSRGERMIGGVLGGLGSYLGVDPTILRVIYVLFALLTWFGPLVVVYVIAMIVIPEEPAGGASVAAPTWPQTGAPRVEPTSRPSSGWPHTGRETVQTPPPPPPAPDQETPPSAEGPVQS